MNETAQIDENSEVHKQLSNKSAKIEKISLEQLKITKID